MTTQTDQVTSSHMSSHEALLSECEKLAHVPNDDIHQIASLFAQMSVQYYQDVRQQAQRSFSSALGAAVVGLIVFIYAAIIAMNSANNIEVYVSALAGGLIELISGINFYLYFRTARQFAAFHTCLERTNRFLIANAMCEHLGERKDEMRAELIRVVANAPLLTLRLLENGENVDK